MNNNQTTQTPRQLPLPPGQRQPQPAQPDHSTFSAVAQHPHFQAPPQNPQRTVLQPLRRPPLEQSAFNTHCDYGSQRRGQQQYHVPPPVARPPPQLVAQPNYNSYRPTAGYPRHYVPPPVASYQPQLPSYHRPQPQQQQQQQRWYHTLVQFLIARHRKFDSPNSNSQAQQHAPPPSQPQIQVLPPPAQNTGVYPGQSQGSGRGGGDGCLNDVQPSANKGGQVGNREWRGGRGRGARGGTVSGNRGEMAGRGRDGSYMDSGGVRAHWSGGNVGGASVQAEGRNTLPTSAKPAAVPVATQLQGAQNINVSGNPTLMNIGTNTGNLTTVNNCGGTHGLEKLERFVSFAALHDSAEQDPDRRCHLGTRKTVLTRLRYWFDNPNATDRIVWLHGPAGAGKSAIAQTIADEYKKRGMAATFFFYRSDASRNDGNRLFPTITWQLAFSIPPTKDFIIHALDKTPHLPTQAVEPQFEQLVAHPFQPTNNIASQMSHRAPVVIIDGVDECSDEKLQQRFLTVIGNAVKNHCVPLRFIIVSRPEALIEGTLNKFKDFTVSIDLAKLDDSNRDIYKFLEAKFSEIASDRGLHSAWPGQGIIKEIVFKSSGNFIFASLVIRFISDEDCDPEVQLNIIRNVKSRGNMSPFALLDELFLEILRRQRDQDFLKTFLALLLARTSIEQKGLHEDDAMLMDVSQKDLHIRLRRMRSLLKFEPFIDVYHKSFLDFLQDPSRSGQYHVSERGRLKRYLELMVDSVVRHVSMAIEQPNCHKTCRSSPAFKSIVKSQPPMIVLPVEDWQEALRPLLDLQGKLLKTSKPQSCRVTQVMRDLLLHLVVLQGNFHHIADQALVSDMNATITEWSPEAQENIPENDLDGCLSVLLSCLQKTDLVMVVDRAILDHMFSLLAFDYAEIVARVRTVSDAQKLIDLIDLLTNNESFLRQCGSDAACKAARLASEIFAKVPLLPQSLFSNRPGGYIRPPLSELFELECQTAVISRILDHDHIVPVLRMFVGSDRLRLVNGDRNEQNESVYKWLGRSRPDLVARIRVILEVARTIRYIHSMDVALYSYFIRSKYFFLNSDLRSAKVEFIGLFAWWVREASIYGYDYVLSANCTYGSNISAFANLFHEVCFEGRNEHHRLVKDAMQLIDQCRGEDLKSQPTMEDVVKEMETWDLTKLLEPSTSNWAY